MRVELMNFLNALEISKFVRRSSWQDKNVVITFRPFKISKYHEPEIIQRVNRGNNRTQGPLNLTREDFLSNDWEIAPAPVHIGSKENV